MFINCNKDLDGSVVVGKILVVDPVQLQLCCDAGPVRARGPLLPLGAGQVLAQHAVRTRYYLQHQPMEIIFPTRRRICQWFWICIWRSSRIGIPMRNSNVDSDLAMLLLRSMLWTWEMKSVYRLISNYLNRTRIKICIGSAEPRAVFRENSRDDFDSLSNTSA